MYFFLPYIYLNPALVTLLLVTEGVLTNTPGHIFGRSPLVALQQEERKGGSFRVCPLHSEIRETVCLCFPTSGMGGKCWCLYPEEPLLGNKGAKALPSPLSPLPDTSSGFAGVPHSGSQTCNASTSHSHTFLTL